MLEIDFETYFIIYIFIFLMMVWLSFLSNEVKQEAFQKCWLCALILILIIPIPFVLAIIGIFRVLMEIKIVKI